MSGNKYILSGTVCTLVYFGLSGCSNHHHDLHWKHNQEHPHVQNNSSNLSNWQLDTKSYRPTHTHKLLSDYTEKMAMKLIENMKYVSDRTPIAVTSFVDLDNNLKTTGVLGNQLAQNFMSELQEFGLSVVDVNHTGSVSVTSKGDFSFSRDGNELGQYPEIDYVLSGTLTYNDRGVIVNARMIGVDSKVVVASSSGFIPHFIVESLYSKQFKDGIKVSNL